MNYSLRHFAKFGIKMIPALETGPTIFKWSNRENFTCDPEEILSFWENNLRLFRFEPVQKGLLVLDLDRKNGKDGLNTLENELIKKNIILPFPISKPPVYTETPNNGLHIYFKFDGNEPVFKIKEPFPGVEIIHINKLCTAPGSVKDGKEYKFRGSLYEVPTIPLTLFRLLTKHHEYYPPVKPKPYLPKQHVKKKISLEQIRDTLIKQGVFPAEGTRNSFCFEFSRYANKNGYRLQEAKEFLSQAVEGFNSPQVNGFAAVKSAYKRKMR